MYKDTEQKDICSICKMPKDKGNEILEGILIGLASIGGAVLFAEIIKMFGQKQIVYRCPNCTGAIKYKTTPCPHCSISLEWDF